MDFKTRSHTEEQLDDLSLSGNTLQRTLINLKWINSFFGNHKQLYKALITYLQDSDLQKPIRIIDLGSGGGDSIYYLQKKLKSHHISTKCIGIDGNPESTKYATNTYISTKNLTFITADILDKKFMIPECDILISSHFMYHFKDKELTDFLKKIKESSVKLVIFSELRRSKVAYLLFRIFGRIFPISKMAKKDGLLAIRRAFTTNELHTVIKNSSITDYKIYNKTWFRTLTTLKLPNEKNTPVTP